MSISRLKARPPAPAERAAHERPLFAGRSRAVLAVIFILSAVGLAYEVTLTRLFSLIFQYHYVFLVVSVSIAGLSLGAAFATLALRGGKGEDDWVTLTSTALLLALLLVGVSVALSQLQSAAQMGLAVFGAVLPFVAIGFLNASLFSRFARSGGVLYAADLLGGAAGVVLALLIVGWLGAFDAVFALVVLATGAAALLAWIGRLRTLRSRTFVALAGAVALLIANRATGAIAFSPATLTDAPPDKTMMAVLQNPRARLVETRWDSFARVDLVEIGDPTVQLVFTDGGAGSTMIRYTGDDSRVAWLRNEIQYLPFTIAPDAMDHVLVLGAGAGKDVLMARLAGAERITAVEINPSLVALTRDQAAYNGGIFDLPGVETVITDGRNYIERSTEQYDLIYANIVYSQAAAPGHSGLAESYVFTREALQTYWRHLSERGRIGFVTHHAVEGLRLTLGALDMLQHEGLTLQQALAHVGLVSLRSNDPQNRPSVVMITRQPWTSDAAMRFASEARQRGAGALYMPYYMEQGFMPLIEGARTLEQYIAANPEWNYGPTTDDSPFFYQFVPGLPPGLSDLLWISGALVFGYFSWLIFFFVRTDNGHWKRVSLGPYFALLGVGYMLVQVPLIQRFGLLLGQPVVSLVVVIGALLIGGGLGSLFSSRFPVERLPRLSPLFAGGVAVAVALSLAVYPALIGWALPLELPVRALVTFLALLPLGFLMGAPFPSGLRVAHRADPRGLAAFWGANAVTSVLGSTLAMVLAVSAGFTAAQVVGALCYGLVAILAALVWPRLLAT